MHIIPICVCIPVNILIDGSTMHKSYKYMRQSIGGALLYYKFYFHFCYISLGCFIFWHHSNFLTCDSIIRITEEIARLSSHACFTGFLSFLVFYFQVSPRVFSFVRPTPATAFFLHFFFSSLPNSSARGTPKRQRSGGRREEIAACSRRSERRPCAAVERSSLRPSASWGGHRGVSELLCRRSSSSDSLVHKLVVLPLLVVKNNSVSGRRPAYSLLLFW
jgi:hypothetical protein